MTFPRIKKSINIKNMFIKIKYFMKIKSKEATKVIKPILQMK